MELNAAIKQLRGTESQQVFATRMGISISALQNYERASEPRRPTLPLLVALTEEARATAKPGLANAFWRAFLEDSGIRERVRYFGFKAQPGELPKSYFFWSVQPDADPREHRALWELTEALDEVYSADPETKERGLQKLEAAVKALRRSEPTATKKGKAK